MDSIYKEIVRKQAQGKKLFTGAYAIQHIRVLKIYPFHFACDVQSVQPAKSRLTVEVTSAYDEAGTEPTALFAVSLHNDQSWWGIGVFCAASHMLRFLETGDPDVLGENQSVITKNDRALLAKLLESSSPA